MSNLQPNQPSPYATAPEVSGKNSKPRGTVALVVGVVIAVVFVLAACGGLGFALLLPAISNARSAAQQVSEQNNLRMIGLALHGYHDAYKQLPCTVSTDADGKVISTWRTALAPFLEGGPPMGASPVASMAPFPLQPVPTASPGETNLFAVVTPDGVFAAQPNTAVCLQDVHDGLANTVMAIKLPNRTTAWTSNSNLSPDEAFEAIQSISKSQAGFWLMGDGSVKRIVLPLDRSTFDDLIKRDNLAAGPTP